MRNPRFDTPLVWLSILGGLPEVGLEECVLDQAANVSRTEAGVLWYEVVVAAEPGAAGKSVCRVTVVAHLAASDVPVRYEDERVDDAVSRTFAVLARRLAWRRLADEEPLQAANAAGTSPPVPVCDSCDATEDLLMLPTLALGDDLPGVLLCRRCCSELPILEALTEF